MPKAKFQRKAYHREFEGYTEVKVPKKNGKGTRIKRVYTGDFYRSNVSDKEWRQHRIFCRVCYIAGIVLSLAAMSLRVDSNSCVYVIVPCMLGILCFMWLSYGFIPFTLDGRNLKVSELRERMTVISASMVTALSFLAAGICTLVYLILSRPAQVPKEIFCSVLFFIGSVLMYMIHSTEKKLEYDRQKNPENGPDDGYDIRYNENN